MIAAIVKEAAIAKEYLANESIQSIYFGGGTPSLCSIEEIQSILSVIRSEYKVDTEAEITLEANPDDITLEKLNAWKSSGINRLSIGVQSFYEEDLQWMNRAHHAEQSVSALALAKSVFNNITIDLIYGTPQMTDAKWRTNIATAVKLDIPHLSCYALTVESKTPLDKMIRLNQSPTIDPDLQSVQFMILMEEMHKHGYEHYEISNFSKPGWRSRHNSSYWKGSRYLGLGPSAHSFDGKSRQWNIANNTRYISSIEEGKIPFEIETLTGTQQLNEYIMTAIRTAEGIQLEILQSSFNISPDEFISKALKFTGTNLMVIEDNSIRLTREGKLLADGIAADLFY